MGEPVSQTPITLIAGPQLLGFFFSWGLHGVLCIQVYFYHLSFPNDRPALKWLVYGVLIFEWVQLGLTTAMAFQIYVHDFGDVSSLTSYHNSWFSVPIMSSIIAGVVQCFYARRLWVLTRSMILTVFLVFMAIASAVLGIAAGVIVHVLDAAANTESLNKPITGASLITATVVDTIIAAAMTYYLLRSKSGIKRSDDMVNKLVRLIIETGALTAAVSFLYSYLIMRETNNLLFQCPALVLPKLYSNSLIVNLNNRAFVRASNRPSLNTGGAFGSAMQPVFVNNDTEAYGDGDTRSRKDMQKGTLELLPVHSSASGHGHK